MIFSLRAVNSSFITKSLRSKTADFPTSAEQWPNQKKTILLTFILLHPILMPFLLLQILVKVDILVAWLVSRNGSYGWEQKEILWAHVPMSGGGRQETEADGLWAPGKAFLALET